MERCGGDRGKGFFWSIDEKYAQSFEEQETRALQNATQTTGGKDGLSKPGKRKDRSAPLDPPLKRSIKGEPKGPLPPPLTSVPLIPKAAGANPPTVPTLAPAPNPNPNAATGVFSYNAQAQASSSSSPPSTSYSAAIPPTNPYATLVQTAWNLHPSAPAKSMASIPVQPSLMTTSSTVSNSSATPTPTVTPSVSVAASTQAKPMLPPINTNLVPDVVIPIVLGSIPSTHPDYAPGHPNNSVKPGYMILHERKLILDPDVFSGLTQDMLKELEKMGAMAAVKVLTGHMVRALKERRAKTKNKDKSAKKAAKAAKKAAAAAVTATTAPSGLDLSCAALGTTDPSSNSAAPSELSTHTLATPTSMPTVAIGSTDDALVDPGSPIIIIDDSEDEAPVAKRRRLDDDGMRSAISMTA